jgi:hypothetical protein
VRSLIPVTVVGEVSPALSGGREALSPPTLP